MRPASSTGARLRAAAASSLLLVLAGVVACDGTAGTPITGSGAGSLRITTTTTGVGTDPDGYRYTIDGGSAQALPTNGTLTLNGLAVGSHTLGVDDVAASCTLDGANPRSVRVTASVVADVALAVACAAGHPAGNVVAIRTISGAPYGVAVSRDGVIYVALIGASELIKGDLATMSFGSLVTVGDQPPHVALDPAGTTAYATLQAGRGLVFVDVATNALVATLPLASDGFNLIVSPDGARVYATTADGTLYVVNAATRTVVTTLAVGPAANGLAFSPDAKTLYVTSRDAGTVKAINTATNTITHSYVLGGMPQRLAVSLDGTELYVANEVSGLQVVTLATGVVSNISLGGAAYGLGLTPDGEQIYVTMPQAGRVRVFDRATRVVVNTITIGGIPRNVAFDAGGRTALVTNESAVVFIQ